MVAAPRHRTSTDQLWPGARVLLIEDEPFLVDLVCQGLRATGFAVEIATDGIEGQHRALRETFDAIVLDLTLPLHGGLKTLAAIRTSTPHTPVIILTANDEVDQRVAALDAGAADVVPKPFSVAELAARLRAQIRRARTATTLSAAGIDVDLVSGEVRRDGVPVRLSRKELALLAHLMRRRGAVCSREEILAAVWGHPGPATDIVDVYVSYLRRKLALPGRPLPLITVRSVGYRLVG